MNLRFLLGTLLCSICIIVIGCNRSTVGKVDLTYQNLTQISHAYYEFTEKASRPPTSWNDLKPHLTEFGDPAKIMISTNDNPEIVVYWNVQVNPGTPIPVIAHEKSSTKGKRLVLEGKVIHELTDEEFKKKPFPPGIKAPF